MPQIYYWVVCKICVQKTWRIFAVKGFLLIMITIQYRVMSLGRVILLLTPVIGGEMVLFAPGNPATFKIISLLSNIIRMTLSFVCHCFSCFWLFFQRTILRKIPHSRYQQGDDCSNGSSIVYKVGWFLDLHGMLVWNWESSGLVVHNDAIDG